MLPLLFGGAASGQPRVDDTALGVAVGVMQPSGRDRDENEAVTGDVGGHASNEQLDEYDQVLSERRAVTVRDNLAEKGIDAARVTVVGYGKQQALVPNDSEANRSQNRRAIVTPVYPEWGSWVRHAGRALLTAFCTDEDGAGLLAPLRPAFSGPATTR